MSLEAKIEALTAAVAKLTAVLEAGNVAPAAAPVQVAAPVVAAPAPAAPAPVATPAPVAAAPAMPAPPTFTAPAPAAPAANSAPFNDGKGLIEYVMDTYKVLGPAKGAAIQGVLTSLGYQNINDVKAEHYATLYSGIEALKAA